MTSIEDWLPPGRRVELPGRGTTFVREMAGPPGAPTLVLLHGLTATGGLNWFACFQPLGRHFRVVALDQRGHGRGIRTRRFRLADCADDVAALADVLGIERFVPVGYSMGGPVAQLTWHRHRDRVQGLVLCATSRNFRGHPRERLLFGALPGITAALRLAPLQVRRGVVQTVLANRIPDTSVQAWVMAEMGNNDPVTIAAAAASLGRFTSHAWIDQVDVPVAVVVTARDNLVPARRQLKLADSIPGATVHVVDDDHTACVNRGNRFVPVLLEACRSVTDRAAARL